jgi:hypothetical protein|tara:strand:+ start:467 stop:574 length:108 start_codon:yes stop_codon:yes gene_type:complete
MVKFFFCRRRKEKKRGEERGKKHAPQKTEESTPYK